MKFALAVLLVLLAVPTWAQPSPDRHAHWLTIAYGGLAGADIGMTMACVGARTCREANPLLRPLQDRPALFGGVKAAFQTASIIAVYRWTKPHSKQRYAVLGALIAGQAAVVAFNARRVRKE